MQTSIYFQFYLDLTTFNHTFLLLILVFIFRFKNFFQSLFFFSTSCPLLYLIKICTGLINSTLPQKAMTFLSGGFTTARPHQPQLNKTKPTPVPSLQDVPSTFVITDIDCPITTLQLNFSPSYRYSKQSPTPPTCTSTSPKSGPHPILLPGHIQLGLYISCSATFEQLLVLRATFRISCNCFSFLNNFLAF